jgi:hypothetical protein
MLGFAGGNEVGLPVLVGDVALESGGFEPGAFGLGVDGVELEIPGAGASSVELAPFEGLALGEPQLVLDSAKQHGHSQYTELVTNG